MSDRFIRSFDTEFSYGCDATFYCQDKIGRDILFATPAGIAQTGETLGSHLYPQGE
jgi:hypothetical protein